MENKKFKLSSTLAAILTFSAICSFCGCSPQTGIRSGQVLNTINNEPIQGAVVCFDWRFGGVLGLGPIGGKYYETSTDKDGKYYVPSQTINKPNFMYGNLEEEVLFYKDGYAVYIADLSRCGPFTPVIKPIGYPDDNQTYHEKNNIVKLYPWKEGESHDRHISGINTITFYGKGELLKKELEPERKRAREENLNKRREAENKLKEEKKRAKERANAWHNEAGWPVGCNFIPSTAINQLEMWQKDTYDPNTINRELGWAEQIGFNAVKVYLHYLVWQQDPNAFKGRMENFLGICEKHKIRVIFVLFDDCWNGNARLGKQPEPKPGVHNSGWLQCPRYSEVGNELMYPVFEKYVDDLLRYFGKDKRVLMWDLYNEPGASHKPQVIFPFLKKVVEWARQANPAQPLTIGVWKWADEHKELNDFQLSNSDVISFHNYSGLDVMKSDIARYKSFGRPVVCTEYLARGAGSKFETHLPLLKEENVGAINWGLVSGKTQTIFPWGSPLNAPEPNVWHHDIFRKDGTPFDSKEIELIKKLMKKN